MVQFGPQSTGHPFSVYEISNGAASWLSASFRGSISLPDLPTPYFTAGISLGKNAAVLRSILCQCRGAVDPRHTKNDCLTSKSGCCFKILLTLHCQKGQNFDKYFVRFLGHGGVPKIYAVEIY